MGPLTPQSDALTTRPLRPVFIAIYINIAIYAMHWFNLRCCADGDDLPTADLGTLYGTSCRYTRMWISWRTLPDSNKGLVVTILNNTSCKLQLIYTVYPHSLYFEKQCNFNTWKLFVYLKTTWQHFLDARNGQDSFCVDMDKILSEWNTFCFCRVLLNCVALSCFTFPVARFCSKTR